MACRTLDEDRRAVTITPQTPVCNRAARSRCPAGWPICVPACAADQKLRRSTIFCVPRIEGLRFFCLFRGRSNWPLRYANSAQPFEASNQTSATDVARYSRLFSACLSTGRVIETKGSCSCQPAGHPCRRVPGTSASRRPSWCCRLASSTHLTCSLQGHPGRIHQDAEQEARSFKSLGQAGPCTLKGEAGRRMRSGCQAAP